MEQNRETLLEMSGITKRFPGVKALDNAALEIRAGEVHAIVGENGAGKSTLMKILLGIHAPDEGKITMDGREVRFRNPHDAIGHGISMIHQETSLMPTTSVSENVWVGREKDFTKFGIMDVRLRDRKTREILDRLGIEIDPKAVIKTLTVAKMQLVEVARAVSYNSRIIIMDEPTSSLSDRDTKLLFHIIKDLTAEGIAVIFISHKLDEVLAVSDRVTAMRDGKYIATADARNCTKDDLIKWIVGREMNGMYPKEPAEIGDVVLEVEHLSTEDKRVRDVSFSLRRGEILGFAGLVGAGRTEAVRALFGIDKPETGEIRIHGRPVKIKNPRAAINLGMGMVTEDRLRLGIFGKLSVKQNMSTAYLKKITDKLGFVNFPRETQNCEEMREKLEIKFSSQKQLISGLSGGNQQKVIIARWLLSQPEILILDEPTRGIDVGAKAEIHRRISLLAQQGMAIILISSELEEVMGMSDRIVVMRNGSVAGEHLRENADSQQIMKEAFGA